MKIILEIEDYLEGDLTVPEMQSIKEWVRKYEKYYNFHNSGDFSSLIEEFTDDCIKNLEYPESKREDVAEYLQTLYNLSDGLSVVMAPDAQFQYNTIDQVQRFQY